MSSLLEAPAEYLKRFFGDLSKNEEDKRRDLIREERAYDHLCA